MANKRITKITVPDDSRVVRTYQFGEADGIRFVGMVSAKPSGTTYTLIGETTPITASEGDLVIFQTTEYLYAGNSIWKLIGDESHHISGITTDTQSVVNSASTGTATTVYTSISGTANTKNGISSLGKDIASIVSGLDYDEETVLDDISGVGSQKVITSVSNDSLSSVISSSVSSTTQIPTALDTTDITFLKSASMDTVKSGYLSISGANGITRSIATSKTNQTVYSKVNTSYGYVSRATVDEANETLVLADVSAVTGTSLLSTDGFSGFSAISGVAGTTVYQSVDTSRQNVYTSVNAQTADGVYGSVIPTSFNGTTVATAVTYGVARFATSVNTTDDTAKTSVTYGTETVIANPSLKSNITAVTSVTPTDQALYSSVSLGDTKTSYGKVNSGTTNAVEHINIVRTKADFIVYDGSNPLTVDYSGGWTTSHSPGTTGSQRTIRVTPDLYVHAKNTAKIDATITSTDVLPLSEYSTMRITCKLKTYDGYNTRGTATISIGDTVIFNGNTGSGKQYQTLEERVVDISSYGDNTIKLYAKAGIDTLDSYYGEVQITKIVLE